MNQNENKETKTKNRREPGSPRKKPEGASCSHKRAAFGASSTNTKRTGAKLGPEDKASTSKGAEAKAGPQKVVALEAAKLKPCGQNTAEKQGERGDAKRSTAGSASAREWPAFSMQDPSKAKYAERRRAAYLLRLVELKPPTKEELTKELQASIDCARAVIPNFKLEPPVKAAKRQRSAEEAKPSAKRPKTKGVTPAKSFAEVARNRIVIGVLDEGDPEGRIPRAQWKWVQAALTNVALEVLLSNPGPPPSCADAGWYQGQIKMIACDDERSVALYKAAIAKVGEVYPGAKLVAVDKKDIPSRPRARVWIPATPTQPDQIMQLIRACNPSLPTEGWRYVKTFEDSVAESGVETKRATMQILLLLTKESIEPLAKSGGEINYGFTKVRITPYKSDADAADHLASGKEICEVEEDPMESSSDAESMEQGECSSSESKLAARLSSLYTEKELLSDSQEDADITIVNASSTN
ncbi:uncharacterized protein [Bactrocera oleae]|uniref:uncharacterized protein isoform X1 n=1 Tax=Bactrocera oleae TaxID=104688 RepID=UPI00174B2691|nr:uncharacterized protein LOC106624424 isoform X1 [Bactrocera oleae]XP_036214313.1 uncharacterized protein LOC106624424 isoform X2 [Bactrocera oleae]XP_036214324.1 uncharacterized protein LOC106624424 isoform X2 [Bactrocera oleae]